MTSPFLTDQPSYVQQGFPHGVPGWYGSRTDLPSRRPVPNADKYWTRFLKVYYDVCNSSGAVLPSLPLRTQALYSYTAEDEALADELYLQETSKISRSKSLWRSQKRTENNSYRIATDALLRLVQEGGRPAVAQVLVKRGGSIVLSKEPQKQAKQISDRHSLITLATSLSRDSLVDYFASISPPERISEALAIAITADNLGIVRILLEHGASPESLLQTIPDHVNILDFPMFELLLQSPTPVSSSTRSRWLNSATACGKMELSRLLLRSGASPTPDYQHLLQRAIAELHIPAFLEGLRCMHRSGKMHFSGILPQLTKSPDMSFTDKMLAVEATLCVAHSREARAHRQRLRVSFLFEQDASEALDFCTSSAQIGLVDLLREARFNTQVSLKTLERAIKSCDFHLLEHLYPPTSPMKLPEKFLLQAMPKLQDATTRERLLLRLLELKIPGAYLDEELILAIVNQDTIMTKSLLGAGASADFDNGKALIVAVDAHDVRFVKELLPRSSKETREAVFPRLRNAEKLVRRLLTKLFLDQGMGSGVLHSALRDAVCDCTALRDEFLIDVLVKAGADFRLVEGPSVQNLIVQGEVKPIDGLLRRMAGSTLPSRPTTEFVSQLMVYLMEIPLHQENLLERFEMVKTFLKHGALGESVVSAFKEFLYATTWNDEELLCLFMTPNVANRTAAYNILMVEVLITVDVWVLYRLIPKLELYEEVLKLTLERFACMALSDDTSVAERIRCMLTHADHLDFQEALERGLEFHVRFYAARCPSSMIWPSQTIDALLSRGLNNTIWLAHSLMAITKAGNTAILTRVLAATHGVSITDTIDSALMLAVQHQPCCNKSVLECLLDFGASRSGIDMALLLSSETGNVQICSHLLHHGADVNYQFGECLISAVRLKELPTLEVLIDSGVANNDSLERLWTFVTTSSPEISTAYKLRVCGRLLQAGFTSPQVRDCLFSCIQRQEPDYDMVTMILDISMEVVRSEDLTESPEHGTDSSFLDERGSSLFSAALTRAIGTGNGRMCRLILAYLPEHFHVPAQLLEKATVTSTAILALLIERVPPANRLKASTCCLLYAVTYAKNPGTCTYLLYEGASCELSNYASLIAATERALQRRFSDRAYLEALLCSRPSEKAMKAVWDIAMRVFESNDENIGHGYHYLRALKVFQLVLSAGFQDIEAFKACVLALCSHSRYQNSSCHTPARKRAARDRDCCPFQRTVDMIGLLLRSLLDLGLTPDQDDGLSIVVATRNHQHEILDILLSNFKGQIAEGTSQWFAEQENCEIFFHNSSHNVKQRQARVKTLQTLLRHGASCAALEEAVLVAVQESLENGEAREVADLLLRSRIRGKPGAVLQFLIENLQPELRPLLSLALEREPSIDRRLKAVETLIASHLDEENTSALVLSALCGLSSQFLDMSTEETHNLLRLTSQAAKSQTLILLLSCIAEKSMLSPFYASSSFLAWLLQSCTDLKECILIAVLEWLGDEEIAKIELSSDSLCLVQEAVLNRKFHLIPILVSHGAATTTKEGISLLRYTVENTQGQSPIVTAAMAALCNDLTLNDGSLHLAVTSMREQVVNLLLEKGHDANSGPAFELSSAEQSLPVNALCATASVVTHESDCGLTFQRIMTNLIIHGAEMQSKMCGRSPLFSALDNPDCTVGLLRNVMDCFRFSEDLRRLATETNVKCTEEVEDNQSFITAPSTASITEKAEKPSFFEFEDDGHHYSASMYLERDIPCPPHLKPTRFSPERKSALLDYLRSQDLPDIFYALEGPQPEAAVGVPLELLLGSQGCAVCGDAVTDINDAFGNLTETCSHGWTSFMCRDCLDGYMTSKITVEHGAVNAKVQCWAEGCLELLNHYEIQIYSNTDLFEVYDVALLQQTLHEGETYAECSTKKCKGGGWLENEYVSYFQCYVCFQETCVSHNGPRNDHAGKPCPATPEGQRYAEEEAREEAERQAALVAKTKAEAEAKKKAKIEADRLAKERKDGLKATEALMNQISKKCPTCKIPVQKMSGCDHMTCRTTSGRVGCGGEFCWECLCPYTRIRTEGNSAHEPTCPHHRRNTYMH